MTEAELIRQAQDGNQSAFRDLVFRYAGVTQRTARVLLANPLDAEDAVQEAWLDAWRSMARVRPDHPFRPWILTLTANRCRMSARKKSLVSVPYSPDMEESLNVAMAQPITGQSDDEELEQALASLQESQRQVVALRYYADLSLEEIAELTNTPLGTVKSRLHRALGSLRVYLARSTSAT